MGISDSEGDEGAERYGHLLDFGEEGWVAGFEALGEHCVGIFSYAVWVGAWSVH
jgi:hypothetical protein